MKRCTSRPLGAVALGIAGTVLVGLTPAFTRPLTGGSKTVVAESALLSGEGLSPLGPGVALMMGGSGVPIPSQTLVQTAFDNYIVPNGFGAYVPQVLYTPEGLEPVDTGIKSLTMDDSMAQGLVILNNAIKEQLEAGNHVIVGGISQSASIASLEMQNILNGSLGFIPSPEDLGFGLLGNPSAPNGGLLSRFDLPLGTHPGLPSMGYTFSGGTPADTGFETHMYTLEYDGFADFPRYPINLISDLNAVAGMAVVHGLYIQDYLGPGVGVTPEQIADAIVLPTSQDYVGNTTYYMLPYDGQLPLAQLIQLIAGKPLADLLEPDLRVLVNLGYGPDPAIGWSNAPANIETPFGLFPSMDADQWNTVLQALADGTEKGINDFIADVSQSVSSAPAAAAAGLSTVLAGLDHLLTDPPSLNEGMALITDALYQAYSAFLPTADLVNTILTTLPAYGATLFVDYLQDGDLLNAIGMPLAGEVGMLTIGSFFEFGTLLHAAQNIQQDITQLFFG